MGIMGVGLFTFDTSLLLCCWQRRRIQNGTSEPRRWWPRGLVLPPLLALCPVRAARACCAPRVARHVSGICGIVVSRYLSSSATQAAHFGNASHTARTRKGGTLGRRQAALLPRRFSTSYGVRAYRCACESVWRNAETHCGA